MKKRIKNINKIFLVTVITLSFSFFLQRAEAQCTLFCLDTVRVSLSAENCSREITPNLVLYATNLCTYPKKVEVFDTSGNLLSTSPIINKSSFGKIVVAKVTELIANNSCTSIISVLDNTPPVITCNDITVNSNADLNPDLIGKPSLTDNCSDNITLKHIDSYQNFSCTDQFASLVTRSWTTTDEFNNSATCNQLIKLKWLALDDVVFPKDYDGFENPLVACDADTSYLKLGMPLIGGLPINNNIGLTPYFQDQYIPLCGGGFRLLRLWNVVNNCTNEFKNDVQLIEGRDVQAPKLTCPSAVTISTNEQDCKANFNITNPVVTDNCSKWTLDLATNQGTLDSSKKNLSDLPIGESIITFYAKDACENIDSCFQKITVIDNASPILVTKIDYTLFLDTLGNSKLEIATINEGTYDNCGVIKDISFRRLATANKPKSNWSNELYFDCEDIDTKNEIEILTTDNSGNTSNRILQIFVKDNLSPIIQCPANISITCDKVLNSNDLAGTPTVKDNCSFETSFVDINKMNGCGTGSLERIWTAKDKSPRTSNCTQYIYITNNQSLNINLKDPSDPNDDVVWPSNLNVEGCTNNILPKETGEPIVHYPQQYCGAISSSYEDQIFPASGSYCYRVERKWTLIDRCLYQSSNYTKGKWEYFQELLVSNKTAPQFTRCNDTTYNVSIANCGPAVIKIKGYATDDCTPAGLLQWTCNVDRNNDGTVDVIGRSNSLTAGFSPGKHRIIWEVLDGCNNLSSCEYVITVRDGAKPKAICKSEVVIQLESSGNNVAAYITPEMVDNQSTDNCTSNSLLTKYISKSKFDCSDIGTQPLTLHISDLAGNEDTCTTSIVVKDDNKWCVKNVKNEVTGVVKTERGDPVMEVTVGLTNMPNTTTDNVGAYLFENLTQGNSYTVTPVKDMNISNGVSTHDLVLMNKHILGLELLNTPYKIIAADVNNDGKVSTSDMIELRKVILNYTDFFPNNSSWRFINQNTTFSDPTKPLSQPLDGYVNIPSLSGSKQIDFIGIKVGDLSGNASPSNFNSAEERSVLESKEIIANAPKSIDNQNFVQEFDLGEFQSKGVQFCLNYNQEQIEIINVIPHANGMNQSNLNTTKSGEVFVSWNTDQKLTSKKLFSINYKLKDINNKNSIFSLNDKALKSEFIDLNNEVFPLTLNYQNEDNQLFTMDQNTPNPFSHTTSIKVWVPESSDAKMTIMDVNGRVMNTKEMFLEKGSSNLTIEKGNLENGVWLYKLETKFGSLVKKMIVLNN
ncbi:MAG: T9SS type A sorting domain-containing protein [Saprospiraceae bacterium]|nr:T9SS type A sorting domain-containing protein [Saprospiraceae bacterium]